MIWMVEKFTIYHRLEEAACDLEVPIQIEIEYQLEGNTVCASSVSRKVHYNRPLLIKEARSRSVVELDKLIEQAIQEAIDRHFSSKGYILDTG